MTRPPASNLDERNNLQSQRFLSMQPVSSVSRLSFDQDDGAPDKLKMSRGSLKGDVKTHRITGSSALLMGITTPQ